MAEHLVFLTGHLAKARLENILTGLGTTPFTYEIIDIGVKVAALMTEEIVSRRLPRPLKADRVVLPGRFRGHLERLSDEFG
ncbi:dihydropteroate synthase, partial [Rhizobium sp. SEMIA 4085]|nr:dihydropteroate synthase [Rhizobium sp. SEMIA 4085]